MRVFRHPKVSGVARRIRAVLGLEAGVTRGALVERTRTDGHSAGGVAPENMIWIFGTGRTGSTWLAAMMEEPRREALYPRVPVQRCLDPFYKELHPGRGQRPFP